MIKKKLSDYIDINPATKLEKGKCYPFVEMENIVVGIKRPRTENVLIFAGQSCSKFKPNDTLMARITPCLENGKVAKYSNVNAGFGSTEFIVFRGKSGLADDDYVYYLAKSQYIRDMAINSMTGASGRQRADAKFIGKIKWDFPSPNIQTKIASILSVYDDLIENNNKRIKILEQIAENLYKEWFVRFRFPGHETAEFENGIPKGWEILRMENFCYVTDGTHDTPKETNLGVPLVTGRCIRNGFVDYDEAYLISEDDHNKIKKRSGLKSGDILFSNIGTVGNTCLVDYEREFSVKNVIIFKPPIRAISAYLYYWLISPSMQAIFSTQTNGASQQFVGLTFMRRIKILVPNKYIMTSFEKNVAPIIDAMMMLHKENQNLIKQRDLLLPRLMSGKLEV